MTSASQLAFWPASPEETPSGLLFEAEFLSVAEEQHLLGHLEALEFHQIVMHGVAARRVARHFGVDYDYSTRAQTNQPAEPLPDWLDSLRVRCADFAGLQPTALAEALVQRYPEGSTIGWHRDAPTFGLVIGVSLGSSTRMRFRRGSVGHWTAYELELPPRSAYILDGEARSKWQHSIPPMKSLRYSVTFRTLTDRGSRSLGIPAQR